jgi:hypothetical protein
MKYTMLKISVLYALFPSFKRWRYGQISLEEHDLITMESNLD